MGEKLLTGNLTFECLPPLNLYTCTKQEIVAYFVNTYDVYESLFTSLKDESVLLERPEKLRLQLLFYYAHTAAVYMNKLVLAGLVKQEERINFEYDTIFETGVNEMKWDEQGNFRIQGNSQKWPSISQLVDYRRQVKALVIKVINRTPLHLPVNVDSPWWAVFMGLEHDRIHLETSAVLIRQLPIGQVQKPRGWKYAPLTAGNGAGRNELIRVDGQEVILGNDRKYHYFGWDNEFGRRKVNVPAFEANKYLTTNGEYLHFVTSGGYLDSRYWSIEGWEWVQRNKARHPMFWSCGQDCDVNMANCVNCLKNTDRNVQGISNGHDHTPRCDFKYRLMFDLIEMPLDYPVEVNYHEAKAFASWSGPDYRLITEAELRLISSDQETLCDKAQYEGADFTAKVANNNLNYGSSTPVNMYPANNLGFHDSNGNILQWTEDQFTGYPGFDVTYLYLDFSTPEFDGNHHLVLGSSWVTSGIALTRSYRTSFRRHFFQFCGLRLARSVVDDRDNGKVRTINIPATVLKIDPQFLPKPALPNKKYTMNVEETASVHLRYDTDHVLYSMLYAEYGTSHNFSTFLSQKVTTTVKKYNLSHKALHLGCGTGRVSFHMTDLFEQVVAQDVVNRLVEACVQLQNTKNLTYTHFNGFKKTKLTVQLDMDKAYDNLIFKEMSWLPNEVGTVDFILATLLDRTQNIKAWTVRFQEVLSDNGVVMIATTKLTSKDLKLNLGPRFCMVEEEKLQINGPLSDQVMVSVWRKELKC